MAATAIYCDFDAGNDTTGDGTTGTPYKTFQKAHDVIRARGVGTPGQGTETTVWLKGTAAYTEAVIVEDETTASVTLPMIIEGYTTTPGDGGMATFDGENTKAYGFELDSGGDNNVYYWVLKNIEFKRYTTEAWRGVNSNAFIQAVSFQHCRFGNNALAVKGASFYGFLDCWFHDNVTAMDGDWMDAGGSILRCIFEDNTNGLANLDKSGNAIWNCLFIGNVNFSISTTAGIPIINCVIDGKNKTTLVGVDYPSSSSGAFPKILNTIILDCVTGVQGVVAGSEELSAIFNSCFFLNTNDFTRGAAKRTGCVFADPLFVDRDNKDYGITSTSPCKEAGLDLESYDYYTSTASKVDIGLLQENVTGPGGGTVRLGAPLGFSVER